MPLPGADQSSQCNNFVMVLLYSLQDAFIYKRYIHWVVICLSQGLESLVEPTLVLHVLR